jgi:hypothetical protein
MDRRYGTRGVLMLCWSVVVEKGAQPQKFVAAAVSYLIGQRQHAAFKGKGDISDSKKAYQSSGNGMPQTKRLVCGA